MTASLGQAEVDLKLDTDRFEAELRAALRDLKDIKVTVTPVLARGSKGKLEAQLRALDVKVRVTPTIAGTDARRKLQAELNALNTATRKLTVRVEPVLDRTVARDRIQRDLNGIDNLGVTINDFNTTDLTASQAASARRLQALTQSQLRTDNQRLRNAIQYLNVAGRIADQRQRELQNAQNLQILESRNRATALREDLARLRLSTALSREDERRNRILEEQRRNQFSITQSMRELVLQATRLNQLRFDNINQAIGRSIAGESLLTTMGNVFRSALNLRRVALQLGTVLATAFTAGAQAAGALIGAVSVLIDGLGVLAGLGILAVGIKFQLDDPEVKAASDRAAEIFKTTMTEASESLEPVLIGFFDDFGEAFAKQKGALTDFFNTVSGPLERLGQRFNELLGSEKVGALIRRLGESTGKFLDGIDPDAIFDAAIKISDAFSKARDRIREAFGPGIFENASVDGFIKGLEGLTDALVSAGDGVKAFKKAFGEFFDGVKIGFKDVLATIGEVGPELFGSLGPIAKQVAIDIGQVVSSLIEFASVVLPKVEKNAIKFSDVFSDNLSEALDILAEPFAKTLDSILELGTALSPLLPIFARIADALEPIIGTVLEIGKALAPIAVSFFDGLADVLEFLKPGLEAVERLVKRIREFLEDNPGFTNFLGKALLAVTALVLGFLLLRKVINGVLGLGRRIGQLFRGLRAFDFGNIDESMNRLRNRRVEVDIDVNDDEIDEATRRVRSLDELLRNVRRLRIEVDFDDDGIRRRINAIIEQLDRLRDQSRNINIDIETDAESEVNEALAHIRRLDDAILRTRIIEIEIDVDSSEINRALEEIRELDRELSKERKITIRCEKIGDCECDGEEEDDDDDRRRRRPRNRSPKSSPRSPKVPPIPKGVTDSFRELADEADRAGRSVDNLGTRSRGLLGRLGGLRGALGGLSRAFGLYGLAAVAAGASAGTFIDNVRNLPELFNELKTRVSEADGVIGKIGATLGFVAETGLKSFATNIEKILSFFGIDVDLTGLVDSFFAAIEAIDWGAIGTAIKTFFKSALDTAFSFFPDIDLGAMARGLATAIGNIDLGAALSKLKSDITGFLGGVFDGFSWPDLPSIPVPDFSGIKKAIADLKESASGVFDNLFGPEKIAGKAVPAEGPNIQLASLSKPLEDAVTTIQTAKATLSTEIAAINLLASTAFTGLGATLSTGIGTALATGLASIGTQVGTFFTTLLPAAADAGVAGLAASLTTGLSAAMTSAFAPLGAIANSQMAAAMTQAAAGAATGIGVIATTLAAGVTQMGVVFGVLKQVLPQTMLDAMLAAVTAATAGINALVAAVAAGAAAVAAQASAYYNAGVQIGQRLAAGIRSQVGEVRAAAGELAAAAAGNFNASPAKWGPLAGRGDMFYRGQELVNRLIKGLIDKAPELKEFAGRMAGILADFRESDLGKKIEEHLRRIHTQGGFGNNFGRGGAGTVGPGGGGVIGGPSQLTGPGGSNTGSILKYDTQAGIKSGRPGNILQIRPGNIHVSVAGVNDPREFINNLSRELVTNCIGR